MGDLEARRKWVLFRIVQLAKHCHVPPSESWGWTPRRLHEFYECFKQMCEAEKREMEKRH